MSHRQQRLYEVYCSCCISEAELRSRDRSREIDRQIAEDKRRYRNHHPTNILLLGAPGSGESTLLKQANSLFGKDFNNDELSEFRPIVYGQLLKGMKVLAYARRKLKLEWQDPSNQQHEEEILSFNAPLHVDTETFMNYFERIKNLWMDKAIQDVYAGLQLGESSDYFFQHLDRVGHPEYFPTKLDAHYVKAAEGLGGITKHELNVDHTTLSIIHIGDQRYSSPNIKWREFPCFENAESILFLVSCIAYDQFLADGTTNCLVDSCEFFDRIINSFFCAHKSVILFFTKADLLEEKIKHSNINDYFPAFQGDPRKLEDVQSFIFQMFADRRRKNSRALLQSHHFMTTSDPKNITLLFQIIKDSYVCKCSLKSYELL
ncbi:guanine nucleotide-binding protein subunit alpha-13-like [Montipora foliosa]|uniref:guanine nucleotide-binding protein subunit alpha-13-like n=1 Tax=Montipora foliosa TaxID=591990 RepID=UPI0035F13994